MPYVRGERSAGSSTRLDLRVGATLRVVRQPDWDANRIGSITRVVGRTAAGDWELEFPGGVKRRLGQWWVHAALAGAVPAIPVASD